MEQRPVSRLELFLTLLRISATTLGGGAVMIGVMREAMLRRGALTDDELADMITLSMSMPGAMAVSMSWQLGWRLQGFFGGVLAVLATLLPPVLTFLLLSNWLLRHLDSPHLKAFFSGASAALVALLAQITIGIGKKNLISLPDWVVCVIIAGLLMFSGLSPVWAMIGGTLLSLLLKGLCERGKSQC